MRPRSWFALGLVMAMVGPAAAGDEPALKRPKITGVAHLAIYASAQTDVLFDALNSAFAVKPMSAVIGPNGRPPKAS